MDEALLFILLVIFPFGQLISHWPLDIAAGAIFLYTLFFRRKLTPPFKVLSGFIFVGLFSFFLSVFVLKTSVLATGGFYLFRLIAYWFLLNFAVSLVEKHPQVKPLILKSLTAVLAAIAVFGWIQYLWYPDLTALKYLG